MAVLCPDVSDWNVQSIQSILIELQDNDSRQDLSAVKRELIESCGTFPFGVNHDAAEFFETLCALEPKLGLCFQTVYNENIFCSGCGDGHHGPPTIDCAFRLELQAHEGVTSVADLMNNCLAVRDIDQACAICSPNVNLPFKINLSLFSVPRVICIFLQRFGFRGARGSKVMTKVECPDVYNLLGVDLRLAGIIDHFGETLEHGHFSARVRRDGGPWTMMNDEKVGPPGSRTGTEPYIVFYKTINYASSSNSPREDWLWR